MEEESLKNTNIFYVLQVTITIAGRRLRWVINLQKISGFLDSFCFDLVSEFATYLTGDL